MNGGGALLVDGYDQVILDLDGVVYLVDEPIPAAVDAIDRLRREELAVAFVTNNASRRPAQVAELLRGMGVSAEPAEVFTSAAAAAVLLAERFPPGSPVLVVGAEALRTEIRAAGLTPVTTVQDRPVAVVQGYGPRVDWVDLAEASLAVRGGAWWVATNTDPTLPTPRGLVPGNGALVAALRVALDREPDLVVGKPGPDLFRAAADRVGASRPLVVGDRLDTDIEGAVRAGMDGLLVLTGVSRIEALLAAPPPVRPTYVATDLGGLFDPTRVVRMPLGTAAAVDQDDVGWRVTGDASGLVLTGSGPSLDALPVLCAAAWHGGFGAGRTVTAGSEQARKALGELGV